MLTLARKDTLGRIQIDVSAEQNILTDPVLGKVLFVTGRADDKNVEIRVAIPLEPANDPDLARRSPTLKPGRGLFKEILQRLTDIADGKDLSFDMYFVALGSFYSAGPGEPMTFLVRGYKVLKGEEVLVVTYQATNPKTGRKETRVSHGINLKTDQPVVMDDVCIDEVTGAKWNPDMGEYVCHY